MVTCPNTGKTFANVKAMIRFMQKENRRAMREANGSNLQRPLGATANRMDKHGNPIASKSRNGSIDTRDSGRYKMFSTI